MIITELRGGLGNQMFQYAIGKALAVKNKTFLYLDKRPLYDIDETLFVKRPFELNIFNIEFNAASDSQLSIFFPDGHLGWRLLRKLFRTKVQKENGFNYDGQSIRTNSRHIYLQGYWQSEKYFESISDVIRRDFTFMAKVNPETKKIAQEISEGNSVSIHVRRGDYVTSASANHGFIGLTYYKDAFRITAERAKDAKYYIFSDDSAWVKQHLLGYIDSATMVVHNSGEDSWQDMYLMSLCKHNIIANSSFSWWGAWLNKNVDKLVIAPNKWFANEEMNLQTGDLIPNSWIRI
ncbi:MAG: alpha-1,2-fucosyltransferase [Chitinophagaceae bacterium]|nr:alpha-1,2-fucosyltransferase [Chitinophagaceae bacterium]